MNAFVLIAVAAIAPSTGAVDSGAKMPLIAAAPPPALGAALSDRLLQRCRKSGAVCHLDPGGGIVMERPK